MCGCSVFAIGCSLTLSVVCLLLCGGVIACWLLLFVVRCLSSFGGCGRCCALFKCRCLLSGVCFLLCRMCYLLSFGLCSVLVFVVAACCLLVWRAVGCVLLYIKFGCVMFVVVRWSVCAVCCCSLLADCCFLFAVVCCAAVVWCSLFVVRVWVLLLVGAVH